jgi:hypothetical protein
MNVKTGEMGSWSCKNKVAQIAENLNEQTDEEVNKDVEEMIDLLDFPTSASDLQKALDKIKKYASSPKGKEFIELYNGSGIVDTDIKSDVSSTYVTSATGTRAKSEILKLINQIESGKVTTPTPTPGTTGSASVSNIDIKWDTKDDGGGGGGGSKTQQSKYQKCNDFPMNIYCISDKIKEVQKCLGVKDDGKFGPITSEKLGSKTLTKELYDTILANCKTGGDSDKVTEPKREMTPLEPVKIANIEKPDLSVKLPNKLPAVNIPTIKQSKNSFYNALKANGNITGDEAETIREDGVVIPSTRRIKYKGPELNPDQIQDITDVVAELGYYYVKHKEDKRYGDKYVWLKR